MEGKCDAIYFCKKDGRIFFHDDIFCKKPIAAWYCQRIFLTIQLYFLFFYFFLWLNLRLRHQKNCLFKTAFLFAFTFKAMGSNGKNSDMTVRGLAATAYDCARWRRCIDAWNEWVQKIPEGKGGYIPEELWKVVANRGNRLAEKWCFPKQLISDNCQPKDCLKKRLQRQWYGILKENALLGNFQRAPQTHYKPLPMKLKCFWCVVKI